MKLADSPVTQHSFAGIPFYLKRDDLLHSYFTGNKARKFMALLQDTRQGVDTLISYGSAQANSLYSLAALCRIRGWKLEFYVDHIAEWLKQRPIGNYRGALELGAEIFEVSKIHDEPIHPYDFICQIRKPDNSCVVVPEGGRFQQAEHGVKQLAMEILHWSRVETKNNLVVALPSGTGTTALYLHKHLNFHGIDVLTCPCVGGKDYLISQLNQLEEISHPTILKPETPHHFGKLYPQDYAIWQSLLSQTYVEFDLLYDPLMWRCLLNWYHANQDKTLLYIHQGGILGNESMLSRYQRKSALSSNLKFIKDGCK